LNPGRRGGKPATNRLSYGAALHCPLAICAVAASNAVCLGIDFFFLIHLQIQITLTDISHFFFSRMFVLSLFLFLFLLFYIFVDSTTVPGC
jgi:hypothetical protein